MGQVRTTTLVLVLILAIAAASPTRAENVLRWASTTEALTFDPHAAYLAPTIAENHQVYEGLVDFDARYELEPALATAWRLLDLLTWEFELRRGVTFHDGEPFTADDVVFSLGRAASGASQFKGFVRPIASVEAVDDHIVRIRTAAPSPDLPTRLPHVFMMSRRWAERHGATATAPYEDADVAYVERHADGTGPFRLE